MALGLSIGVVDKDVAAVAPLADCFVVLQKGRVAWVGGGALRCLPTRAFCMACSGSEGGGKGSLYDVRLA